MISFAPEHGSVGPHLDSYDVFLFQALGRRDWSINENAYSKDDFVEGLDIGIIDNFQAEQDWILAPGDMLYLPPGVAHWGVALEDCMTYSVGLRAPSRHELVGAYLDDTMSNDSDLRYTDPDLSLPLHMGEIRDIELKKIEALFRSALPDQDELAHWFGKNVTRLPENFASPSVPQQLDTGTFTSLFKDITRLKKCCPFGIYCKRQAHYLICQRGGHHVC